MQLNQDLRADLIWLASNWKEKRLADLSAYNEQFYAALLAVLSERGNLQDVELVIEGTLGKVADGYAHLLDVDPAVQAKDPWVALRRLGEIAVRLKALNVP